MSYSPNPNRATNVPVTVTHADGVSTLSVNQKKDPKVDGMLHSLGRYRFEKGTPAVVTIGNEGTDGYVIVDAVQWVAE